MAEHFNTGEGFPQSREEVRKLGLAGLHEFMGMCDIEPADYEDCLACYAYEEAQRREKVTMGITTQPDPRSNDGVSIHDLVITDMKRRKEFGLRKYGTILQTFNGRNPLQDAYEEVLDLAVYLRQRIEEEAVDDRG